MLPHLCALTSRFAREVDLQILVSSSAGVPEDPVGSRHTAGGTALTLGLHHIQGVGAAAVGVGAGDVAAVGRAQSPVGGRDNVDCRPKPTA